MLSHSFRILMTFFMVVITVVACAPPKSQETLVRIYKRANQDKALVACERSVSSKYDVNIGKGQAELKAPICQTTLDQDGKSKSERSEIDVSYRVGNRSGKLVVALDVGVEFSEGVTDKAKDLAVKILQVECAPALTEIWKRSFRDVSLDLNFAQISPADLNVKYDQYLSLIGNQESTQFSIQGWPDRGLLDFALLEKQSAICAALRPLKRSECQDAAFWRSKSNSNFCKTVASMFGHWLNLPEMRAKNGTCDSSSKPSEPKPSKASEQKDYSFQDFVAADLKATPEDALNPEIAKSVDLFWSKARFSRSDLAVILKPACARFQ